ncbi:putative metal-dependent hydrolase [Rhodococcus rhodochrous J45]|uniref:Putative metal-dependent hydrolase n=1 Tax=Rhodococcus rhodochrous J45 TaxID=935266 RepID=A0A562DMJ9_RHORH|nr:cyclase family protein [Rhodococcus rhodochrous]TWH10899.1 putative metal-dependent hydrolase [Rhodococcus rhodochrous J45]
MSSSPAITRPLPSYRQLQLRPRDVRGTSWGLFGWDDQLGSLNHLHPDRIRSAARLITEGRRINLNLPLTAFSKPLIAHRGHIHHEVFGLNEFHRDDRIDNFFPQASTQIDSLRHFAHPDRGFYNGTDPASITAGTAPLGIQNVAEAGIAGRGVLLDVARYRQWCGRPIDQDRGEQISVADLEATAQWQNLTLEPGDIVLIRTGWIEHFVRHNVPYAGISCGLEQSGEMAAWLWDGQFSLVAADNVALEAWPATNSQLPPARAEVKGALPRSSHTGMLHRILIPLLGIYIGELWDLDELARWCQCASRYAFFLTAEPLHVRGGVGSPANALAIV